MLAPMPKSDEYTRALPVRIECRGSGSLATTMRDVEEHVRDGHLLVYDLDPATGDIGQKLYETRVEGALGANNSIVIADIDGDAQANKELYVAGSQGLWKWVQ